MPIVPEYDLILQKSENVHDAETVATVIGGAVVESDTLIFRVKGGGEFFVNTRNYHVVTTTPRED